MTAASVGAVTGCAAKSLEIRQHLRKRAAEIRAEYEARANTCERTKEWAAIPGEHRMAILLIAGVEGDLQALARRAWNEFTTAEKTAVQVTLRGMHGSLERAFALRVRAG